jgi:large subunit ribosomal protein L25
MNVKIDAQLRTNVKKSDLKNLRKQGFIPAIIYSEGNEGINISLKKVPFMKIYKKTIGEMAFFDINVGDRVYNTIIRERQVHPVSREFVHIDFLEFYKGKQITVNVPLKYIGDAPGTAVGGLLEILVRKLEISCLPKDIPKDIEVDVSALDIGDSIHLKDIDLLNIDTKMDYETTLVAVRAPRKEEVVEVEEEEIVEEGEEVPEGEEQKEEKTEETTD